MDKVKRLVFLLMIIGLGMADLVIPKEAAAVCSCRPDVIQVTTNAAGFSSTSCLQARNRCKSAAIQGADYLCDTYAMSVSCNPTFTFAPCVIYPGPQYTVYCEIVAGCIIC
jgi:hypothetical protein